MCKTGLLYSWPDAKTHRKIFHFLNYHVIAEIVVAAIGIAAIGIAAMSVAVDNPRLDDDPVKFRVKMLFTHIIFLDGFLNPKNGPFTRHFIIPSLPHCIRITKSTIQWRVSSDGSVVDFGLEDPKFKPRWFQ